MHPQRSYLTALAAALLIFGTSLPAEARTRQEIQRDMDIALRRLAEESARVRLYMTYYDQVQRMNVYTGRLAPADADANLRGKGQELFRDSYTDEEFREVYTDHQAAAREFFTTIDQAARAATTYPDEGLRALAPGRLAASQALYGRLMAAGVDPLPALENAVEVAAWAKGSATLTPALNPFAGQQERIAASIPSPLVRDFISAEHQPPSDTSPTPPPTTPTPVAPRSEIPPSTPRPTPDSGGTVVTIPSLPSPPDEPAPPGATPPGSIATPPADSADFHQRFSEAQALYQAGRYQEALPLYDELIDESSTFRQARFDRAVMRLWTNDLIGSLEDFRWLAREKNDRESRRLRALVELAAGNVKEARKEADRLLREKPSDPEAILVAAQAALYDGNQQRAQELFQKLRTLAPQTETGLYTQAGNFLQAGVPAMALVQYDTIVWMNPGQTNAYYGLGFAASRLGQREKAIEAFNRYLQYDATSQWAEQVRSELQRLQSADLMAPEQQQTEEGTVRPVTPRKRRSIFRF